MTDEAKTPAERTRIAANVALALNVLYPAENDPATLLADLLADARHYADHHGLAFAACDERGFRDYTVEAGITLNPWKEV